MLFAVSCSKTKSVEFTSLRNDSAVSEFIKDSSSPNDPAEGVVIIDSVKTSVTPDPFRAVEDGKIIKTVNGDMIPLLLTDEFTADNQQYIIKIKNFSRQNISGTVSPENLNMNIRFNQIRLPNGTFEGPFGREMMFKTRGNGELWLIIGKNNMASGESKGRFSVLIK